MKRPILLLLLIIFSWQLSAQTNPTEAKAAFLLAEESYNQGDYKAALLYLNKAKKSFGATNSKMLYLQLQAELELYRTDKSYYDQVIQTIAAFQSAPDVASFNEEKVLEVMKMKLQLESQLVAQNQQALEEEKRKSAQRHAIAKLRFEDWPFNVTLVSLQEQKKDDPFFASLEPLDHFEDNVYDLTLYFLPELDKYQLKNRTESRYPYINASHGEFAENTIYFEDNKMYGIYVKGSTVKGYAATVFNYLSSSSHNRSKGGADKGAGVG